MKADASDAAVDRLDNYVERYEVARASGGRIDLAAFLPSASHPLYLEVLRELVRIELETDWERGRPTPLDDYRRLHCSDDRRKFNQHTVACSFEYPPTSSNHDRINGCSVLAQSSCRPNLIQPHQSAKSDNVGRQDGGKLPGCVRALSPAGVHPAVLLAVTVRTGFGRNGNRPTQMAERSSFIISNGRFGI